MQSGTARTGQWILEFEPEQPRSIDPLMGYTSSGETLRQVRLSFDTLEAAEAYAQKNGIAYFVQPAQDATPKRQSYPDNFRSDRKTPWTH